MAEDEIVESTEETTAPETTQEADTTAELKDDAAPVVQDDATVETTDETKAETKEQDWRDRMAGDDEKFRKRLDRFASEASFAKSFRTLESKMQSGEYTKALADDASEAEVAAWRKENGLPEKPDEYIAALDLPKGMVLGDEDKPIAESFAQRAHEKNMTPKQFNEVVAWYYENQDIQRAALEDRDAEFKQQSEDDLRAVWEGPDYRRNLNAIQNMMSSWPDGLADSIATARTMDGRLLGDDPVFSQAMAQLALDINPAATLVPTNAGDPGKSVDSRLAEIRKFNRENPDAYDQDKALQEEHQQLIAARDKIKSRAA